MNSPAISTTCTNGAPGSPRRSKASPVAHPPESHRHHVRFRIPEPGRGCWGEIRDPHRFADGSRLASYCAPGARGLAIRRQSHRPQTTRRQPPPQERYVHRRFRRPRHDPHAKVYYRRKIREGKRHNAAVLCVARRRCNIPAHHAQNTNTLPTTTTKNPQKTPTTTRKNSYNTLQTRACLRFVVVVWVGMVGV